MIVRCENCQTEFALEDAQVPPGGVTVRCSVCAHVFTVHAADGSDEPWQIRTIDDLLFTAPDLQTLKLWIDEGRLHPDDQVSRTGQSWLRIGDMPELAASFSGVHASSSVVTSMGPPLEPDSERSAVEALGPPPSFGGESAAPVGQFAPRDGVAQPVERSNTVPWAPAIDNRPKSEKSPSRPPSPPQARKGSESDDDGAEGPADSAPSSPLSAVTRQVSKVRPITKPPVPDGELESAARAAAEKGSEAVVERRPAPSPPPDKPVSRSPSPAPSFDVDFDDDEDDLAPRRRRRRLWPIFAVLGVAAGVGVVFGHPDVRAYVLGSVAPSSAEADADGDQHVEGARAAMARMSLAEVARAEASLQREIDKGGEPAALAAMRLAQGELLIHRALSLRMAAMLDAGKADGYRDRANDDVARAERLLEQITEAPDADHLSLVRAKLRLAQDRPAAEIEALLPADAALERLLLDAAPLWRDPEAAVPEGLLDALQAEEELDGLREGVMLLALDRSGDEAGASREATRVLVTADGHPVALAITGGVAPGEPSGDTDGGTGTGGADAARGDEDGDEDDGEGAKAKPAGDGGDKTTRGGGGGGGGGGGLNALLDKGCRQVEAGSASAGVATLLRAFDRSPNDLDVLVCLGQGYMKMGNLNRADHFLGRALKQSPNHRTALKSSARVAVKRGRTDTALSLYEKVLKVSPSDAEAKAFVAKHGSKPAGGGGAGSPAGGGGQRGDGDGDGSGAGAPAGGGGSGSGSPPPAGGGVP